ncbi:hypothetical protein KP509_28G068600 [Ceratopteris richardii]|uniref:Pentatricopeptide repeat-containing protein n=1 Tax=Ceratopteris richardii TaxID=49495 RepID=A0A8T2RDA1_CERRI|nr:hypothetical protein KP509_28G068600 [Ceratopteris richardii]
MLLEVKCISHAEYVLYNTGRPDNYMWNCVTSAYAKIGDIHTAFDLYQSAKKDSRFCTSSCTYVALLKSCIKTKNIEIGHKLHFDITNLGLLSKDVFIGSTLIAMYIKFGMLARAEDVFSKLQIRNVIIWTTLVDGYVDLGWNREALSCLEKMREEGILLDAHAHACTILF